MSEETVVSATTDGSITVKKKSAEVIEFPSAKGAISKEKTEKDENKTAAKKGRPKSHGLSKTPTYQSFRNAKQRCSNPNSPQYKDYGGRGVEFRFADVWDLLADIGERPDGTTLDRIDPDGHYEAGNVRWATPQEQARNKRKNQYAHSREHYIERSIADRRLRERSGREAWMDTGRLWKLSIKMFNETVLMPYEIDEIVELRKRLNVSHVPSATFPLFGGFDPEDEHFIFLPSLTRPGDHVAVRGHVSFRGFGTVVASERGYVHGLMGVPPQANFNLEEWSQVVGFLRHPTMQGMCITGRPHFNPGEPIEGRLMALASWYSFQKRGGSVRVVPASELSEDLLEYQPDEDSLYQERLLIIPDLYCYGPTGFGLERSLRWKLRQLLEERGEEGRKTIVFAENPEELGQEIAVYLERRYSRLDLAKMQLSKHDAPPPPENDYVTEEWHKFDPEEQEEMKW